MHMSAMIPDSHTRSKGNMDTGHIARAGPYTTRGRDTHHPPLPYPSVPHLPILGLYAAIVMAWSAQSLPS